MVAPGVQGVARPAANLNFVVGEPDPAVAAYRGIVTA